MPESINGVTVVTWEDCYTDVVLSVSEELERWLGSSWTLPLKTSRLMERVADLAERNGWSAVGFLALAGGDPWKAEQQVDDHGLPYYGNTHLCELARGEAEQERVTEVLQAANEQDNPTNLLKGRHVSRETWITADDVLFYDVGAQHTAKAVAELESALSESAGFDEHRAWELEQQAAEEGFRLPVIEGAEPDAYEVFRTYVRMNGTLCPECGIEFDESDALKEHYGDRLVDCFDCEERLLWDGYGERPMCCDHCARERANASVSVEEERGSAVVGIDWGTGDGMVIRFGELYWQWDSVAQVWEHVPHFWSDAVNL